MKSKICILGNSHMACIKNAWKKDESELKEGFEIDFFGATGDILKHIKLDGMILLPTSKTSLKHINITSQGKKNIDLNSYNFFFIAGCGYGIQSLIYILRENDLLEFDRTSKHKQMISKSCFVQSAKDIIENSTALYLYRLLSKKISPEKIFIVEQPYPSENILKRISERHKFMLDLSFKNFIRDLYYKLKEDLTGKGINLRQQPSFLMADDFFTQKIYSRGSKRLVYEDEEHSHKDHFHMNDDFGKYILDDMLNNCQ